MTTMSSKANKSKPKTKMGIEKQKQKQNNHEKEIKDMNIYEFLVSNFYGHAAKQFYCNITQFHAIFEMLMGISLIKCPEGLYMFNNDIYSKKGT